MKRLICFLIILVLVPITTLISCNTNIPDNNNSITKINFSTPDEIILPTLEPLPQKYTELATVKEESTEEAILETETSSPEEIETFLIKEDETSYVEETEYVYIEETESSTEVIVENSSIYSPEDLQTMGVIDWGGWTWTYYSEKVLPGEGLYLPGRNTDENGFICDGDGYICLASTALSWGTIVDTPFGKQGKVYDSGCDSHILDVYVSW